MSDRPIESRRGFLKGSAATIAGVSIAGGVNMTVARMAHAQGSDMLKVALIGCGGRGNGAVRDSLTASDNTKLVAVADALEDRVTGTARRWRNNDEFKDRVDLPDDRVFWGLDAYKHAIESGVDMIIDCSAPGFRPLIYKTAIEAGKHVFMEKPCCIDAPGYRSLVETNKLADEKGLKVGVGLQRRHDRGYVRGIQEIHEGKYGDLILLQAYWNGGGIWWRGPGDDWTEMRKQVNNWYHFVWLSGDNICEQHIHNLDVCNWAKGAHPVEANGMGGGEVRRRDNPGGTQIFDHHFIEFTYPDGTKMYSQCRHVRNAFNRVGEYAFGTQGRGGMTADGDATDGGLPFKFGSMQQEHFTLVEAIRNDTPYNEGHYGATSSMTAVLGRMATYSGRVIRWDEAVERGVDEAPGIENYTMETDPPVMPDEHGQYPIIFPGEYDPFA